MAAESTTASDAKRVTPVVEMRDIKKSFGQVHALDGADLEVRENEIMGLVGDNGAGKSTLIKTLVGLHRPDSGSIFIDGEEVHFEGPRDARSQGIATVYQDLALVDELSVAANTFLGRPKTKRVVGYPINDWEGMEEESQRILRENLDINIDPETNVEFLSGGERQAVAISRALVTDPRLIIMDEPTSALSTEAADRVLELIEQLKKQGMSVLIISHNLDEIFSLCDRITVLANGETVGTFDKNNTSRDEVIQMMITGEHPSSPPE